MTLPRLKSEVERLKRENEEAYDVIAAVAKAVNRSPENTDTVLIALADLYLTASRSVETPPESKCARIIKSLARILRVHELIEHRLLPVAWEMSREHDRGKSRGWRQKQAEITDEGELSDLLRLNRKYGDDISSFGLTLGCYSTSKDDLLKAVARWQDDSTRPLVRKRPEGSNALLLREVAIALGYSHSPNQGLVQIAIEMMWQIDFGRREKTR